MAAAVIILFIALLLIGVPVGAAMGIPAFLYPGIVIAASVTVGNTMCLITSR